MVKAIQRLLRYLRGGVKYHLFVDPASKKGSYQYEIVLIFEKPMQSRPLTPDQCYDEMKLHSWEEIKKLF